MSLHPYRSLAETWRVMESGHRDRDRLIANNLIAMSDQQWKCVYFFYPPASGKTRLSDEDFREIYFNLTDAYPEEVDSDPDPIHLLSQLSQTEVTDASALSVINRMQEIEKVEDNMVRAQLLVNAMLSISPRDLHPLLFRLSVRGGVVRRRDVVRALALANDEPTQHVRMSVNLLGLERTTMKLTIRDFCFAEVRPYVGHPLIIPTPTIVESPEAVPFTKSFIEKIEGTWVTVHVSDNASNPARGFTASGGQVPCEPEDNWIDGWAMTIELDAGMYLCDYAEMRDNPLLMVDVLTPEDPKATFAARRKYIEEHLSDFKWAIKPLIPIDDPLESKEIVADGEPFILRNSRAMLTYENTKDEIVLVRTTTTPRIFRIDAGKVITPNTGGAPYPLWGVAVRDGSDFYRIGELKASGEAEAFIRRHASKWKNAQGEAIAIEVPCYVEVQIDSCGWGEFGPYIVGEILKGSPTSGVADCMGIEEMAFNG